MSNVAANEPGREAGPELLEHLRGLEESLANPDTQRSPAGFATLLANEFREFGSSGRVYDKSQIIAALGGEPPCRLVLTDFHALVLAPDVVLLTYRGTRQFHGSDKISVSTRSSIWARREGRWQVIFHQGTPAGEANASEQGVL